MSEARPILITVHGIRTFGAWQERLKSLVLAERPEFDVKSYRYGYFSVLAFLLPIFRWLAVRSFRQRLRQVIQDNPGSPITIVCHSFGTHIVTYALRGMKSAELPEIPALILSGSVLRSNFDWSRLHKTGKVRLIVNDCGTNDNILMLSQMLVLLTGMAGRVGFYGFTDAFLVNRFFAGGHSHYFSPVSGDPDSFMREWWLPVIARGQSPAVSMAAPEGGALRGVLYAFMRVADPVKGGLYLALIAAVVFIGYVQPRRAAAQEQGRREYQAAAAQVGSDRLVPDAVASLARLISNGTFASPADQARAIEVARIGFQRMRPANDILDNIPVGTFFRWSGAIYLMGGRLARLDVPPPIAQFHDAGTGRSFLVTERAIGGDTNERQVEFLVFDAKRTVLLMRASVTHDGKARNFGAVALKTNPDRVLVRFTINEIEGDDSTMEYVAFDLGPGTARTTGLRDVDLRFRSDCTGLAWFDDEDDESRKMITTASLDYLFRDTVPSQREKRNQDIESSYSGAFPQTCGTTLEAAGIPSVQFPRSIPENQLLAVSATPSAANQADDDTCAVEKVWGVGARAVKDPASLDFSAMVMIGNTLSLEQATSDISDSVCGTSFESAGGRRFFTTIIALGQWIGGRVICEMPDERKLGRCGIYAYSSEGGGGAWRSSAGDYVVLASAKTETSPGGFSLIALASGRSIEPDSIPDGQVFGAALDSNRQVLMVVSEVEGLQGAAELSAYRVDGESVKLTGKRVFEAAYDGALVQDPDVGRDGQGRPALYLKDGLFIVSMIPGALIALDVPDPPGWFGRLVSVISSRLSAGTTLAEATIRTAWSVPQLDLGPATVAELIEGAGGRILVARIGGSFRLYSALDGQALTPRIDAAALNPTCTNKLLSSRVDADDGLTLTFDGCSVSRPAPPSVDKVKTLAEGPQAFFKIEPAETMTLLQPVGQPKPEKATRTDPGPR
jgi:hypothetical protein